MFATLSLDVARALELDASRLLEAARRGDAHAQAQLFESHKQRVARWIHRMIGDPDVVDDLVQEVFIAAFRRLTAFRGEAQIETWLYRIALNKVRNFLDSGRRRLAREQRGAAPTAEDVTPDDSVQAQEDLGRFYDALAGLPASYREAFVARAIHGMSLHEASERLDVPISTVSYRTRRAEALLCEALGLEVKP